MAIPTTTYGINTTSRCTLLKHMPDMHTEDEYNAVLATNAILRDCWVKGELDSTTLSKVTFSYKEHLVSANNEMNDVFDNLTVGLRTKMNLFTGKLNALSMGGGKDTKPTDAAPAGESTSKTSAALLDMVAALSVFDSNSFSDAAGMYQKMVGYAQQYNIPVRTQNPTIAFPMQGGYKINFGWGKAGLYNAKQEVWDPITTIVSKLTPDVVESEFPGMIKIDNAAAIPYQNQTKFLALKSVINDGGTILDQIKEAVTGINNSDVLEKLTDSASKYDALIEKQNKLKQSAEELAEAGTLEKTWDSIKNAFTGSNPGDLQPISSTDTEAFSSSNPIGAMPTNDIGTPSYYTGGVFKGGEKALKEFTTAAKESSDSNGDASLMSVLRNIATLSPRLLSSITMRMKSSVDKAIMDMNLVYLPTDNKGTILFNVQDLSNRMTRSNANDLAFFPLITVSGVPEEIEWGFDFSKIDENGYPMTGYIEIKKLFAVETFGRNFHINATYADYLNHTRYGAAEANNNKTEEAKEAAMANFAPLDWPSKTKTVASASNAMAGDSRYVGKA